ncbi:MAG: LamG domain-containing protein [Acidobacteria bacterium]|nr:LamG domain-containing protein [Acidobacteriota bacterium]
MPELTGYTDPLSVSPGQTIRFFVSTEAPAYEAAIVRLLHGDTDPAGPGFRERLVEASVNRSYAGRKQAARAGSFIIVSHHPSLARLSSLTVQAWISPSARGRRQAILAKWSAGRGFALALDEEGGLALDIGDADGNTQRVSTGRPLRLHEWHFVAAAYDARSHQVRLYQRPVRRWPNDGAEATLRANLKIGGPGATGGPLTIAALEPWRELYNGRIDRPRLFSAALAEGQIEALARGEAPEQVAAQELAAAWDFAREISSARARDSGPSGLHGEILNLPARAVPGYNWTGEECDFRRAPAQYGAIHFHDDDLEDARWEPDFEWVVPQSLASGVYAARLRASALEDHVPFFVRPPRGRATAAAAFLAPTLTYLAYANERLQHTVDLGQPGVTGRPITPDPSDRYLAEHPELGLSVYDYHTDGSGSFYSTRRRPILNMRPKYRMWLTGAPRGLSADLYLIDWLDHQGLACDVITDEDLHGEGAELLRPYKAVLTGGHPEYYTAAMLDGMEQYLNGGGRLMYLGGNGFYWVTTIHPDRPHIIELRRGVGGTGPYKGEPGEGHHSTTGEPGGIWRYRGRGPNRVAGIGFTAMGWDSGGYGYRRRPGSFDERAGFIFEGIGAEEVIGDFGLVMNSAVGDEIDRMDLALGSPPHTLLVASSEVHSSYYSPVIEDLTQVTPSLTKPGNPNVRADMVYFETPGGGAVFSVGSINWCGSLSHNGYKNNVSRITENVLRRFLG